MHLPIVGLTTFDTDSTKLQTSNEEIYIDFLNTLQLVISKFIRHKRPRYSGFAASPIANGTRLLAEDFCLVCFCFSSKMPHLYTPLKCSLCPRKKVTEML